ncbi:hypothetical protein [uncultured Hoeflea sp.]|uniref:hypothetical protein n=1 Tax=uncultured Hoeflea sp. TaxID=538666 RepID=UPI0030EE1EEA|tara:strand:+ start:152806 stop:153081 length:276 start_codon:yes stop_codon:yes gene_type:complete
MPEAREICEMLLGATVFVSLGALIIERMKANKGIGLRALQFAGIGAVVPIIGILALEGIIDGAVIGTLLGSVVGYLFASKDNKANGSQSDA